jgi:hypothetical protein
MHHRRAARTQRIRSLGGCRLPTSNPAAAPHPLQPLHPLHSTTPPPLTQTARPNCPPARLPARPPARPPAAKVYTAVPAFTAHKACLLLAAGLLGGGLSALLGGGLGLCSFLALSSLLRVSEVVAAPTAALVVCANAW